MKDSAATRSPNCQVEVAAEFRFTVRSCRETWSPEQAGITRQTHQARPCKDATYWSNKKTTSSERRGLRRSKPPAEPESGATFPTIFTQHQCSQDGMASTVQTGTSAGRGCVTKWRYGLSRRNFLKGPRTSIKEQPTINCHRDSIDGLIQCAVQDLVDGYGLPTFGWSG